MSIMYKLTEPLEVGIEESMPAEFIKEAERSRVLTVSLTDEIERLKTENAKLRELLLDVWYDAMEFDGFWDYVMDDGEIYCEDELPHYQERMRELGIEV